MMLKKDMIHQIIVDRPLPKGINKKVICLMKDELGGKIITKFVAGEYLNEYLDQITTEKPKHMSRKY